MKIAIFPGSFDIFHDGHLFVLKKSLYFFDKIIILVCNNSFKNHNYSLEFRKNNIINIIKNNNIKNVVVNTNSGSTMKYCETHNILNLIRGIRDNKDYEYEQNLLNDYKSSFKNIKILYIYSNDKFRNIRSSLIINNR